MQEIPALDYRWPACACRTQTGGATGKINVEPAVFLPVCGNKQRFLSPDSGFSFVEMPAQAKA
ncbi:MAG TPA: hypothetical protein ENH38_07210 [Nitrospirae bacterium]|nr:hypothetical protein [Nitrospirota bacterium]HDZ88388.1 hypothetical protein [Nitrospirota bacterium]